MVANLFLRPISPTARLPFKRIHSHLLPQGIDLVKKFANENAIPFKIIFNQVNIRSRLHRRIIQKADRQFNGNLLNQNIRNTIVLAEAFENAQNIFHYKSESSGANDFVKLADELLSFL